MLRLCLAPLTLCLHASKNSNVLEMICFKLRKYFLMNSDNVNAIQLTRNVYV